MKRTRRESIRNPAGKRFKMASFPFMSLPVELRESIFEDVVGSPEVLLLPKYWLDDEVHVSPRGRLSLCHVPTGCSGLKDPHAPELPNTPYDNKLAFPQKYQPAIVYPRFCRKCRSPECVPSGTVYRDPLLVSKAFLAEYGKVLYRQTTFVFNSGRMLDAFLSNTRAIDLQEVRTLRIYFGRTAAKNLPFPLYELRLVPVGAAITDRENQEQFGEDSWHRNINIRLLSGLKDLSLVNVVGNLSWRRSIVSVGRDMNWNNGRWSGEVLMPRQEIQCFAFSTFSEFSHLRIRQVTVDVDSTAFHRYQTTQDQLERWRLTDADKEEYKTKLLKIVTAGNEAECN